MLVYKATNTINSKVYVGQTVRTLNQRVSEHKHNAKYKKKEFSHLYSAINKYGWESFEWEILEVCANKEKLGIAEVKWIARYQSNNRLIGYNKSTGGEFNSSGVVRTDEQKRKISAALRHNPKQGVKIYNKKGLAQTGERNNRAKLGVEDICEIKTIFRFSAMTDVEIAKMYGVQRQAIGKIRNGQRWSHIEIFTERGDDANADHKS